MGTIKVEKPNIIKKTNPKKHPSSRRQSSRRTLTGHILDFVYDVMMSGRSRNELEGDGWHADDIHEAVRTWFELRLLARSEEHGLSLALGLETRFSAVSRSTPAAFSMQSAASRRPQDGANPRRCGPSSGCALREE